ncbi:N-acetyl-gamma-glutamyl-phosphate reductase [Ureibacillus massiliensis 4400831 = CIP 108448 = CCUG 49529]|uniref:N-acetyl-gamma-glutamyl-phosphate reductase n=1 Tax=Ureibacillus massiliensis 4400831 = CIP 108448 = CCUG 49529 TaxID=1211035 RepID=A0A0A3J2G3_9BACL|nr:N-acetyl-gamma-glutamyl-phosphate reductase [Ureibacillus massiliensis]KGR91141.1 N-acetyl-gamma-glutamyl-phosphate reductase [Ureibacillus massiliensis 4400831 = CIP 108448 = CCUG 49529]
MKVGIIGATGYGGLELIRFLHNHPEVEKIDLFTSSDEGTVFSSRFGHLLTIHDEPLKKIGVNTLSNFDVIFTSTPSGVTSKLLPPLVGVGPKLIDLSGDYRLKNPHDYEKWYKKDSAPTELLKDSVYGLTEWNEEEVKKASLIANPGCYPTAVLLSILPFIKEKLIDPSYLIIDAKSGISGAGNKPSQATHFSEANENFSIYKINEHQHIPEIEQAIDLFAGVKTTISFNTHLVPMTRGILATTYAPIFEGVTEEQLIDCLLDTYKNNPFVRIVTDVNSIGTNRVKGSNFCDILVKLDKRTNRVTIIGVIDNLVKGAAGQAIQNMNVQFGLPQTDGLDVVPLFI